MTGKTQDSGIWRRRLRLAGIVAAAAAMATASAFVQACKSAASRSSNSPDEAGETEARDQDRPVTIVVEPAPTASAEPEEGGTGSPEAPPKPDEPDEEPRRGRPADSTIIYE